VTCTGAPSITLDDLVRGGGTGSQNPANPLQLYTCVDPTGAVAGGIDPQICTTMRLDPYNYPGIRAFINMALFGYADPAQGVDPASIVGQFNAGGTISLTAAQVQLIHQSGIQLVPLLAKTSNPATRVAIAQRLGEHLVSCVAAEVGQSLYKAALGVQTGGDTSLSEDTKAHVAKLRDDFMQQREVCLYDHKTLDVIQELNESTRLLARGIK
jgi:conjugative transfer pilus assembly protein TraH